MIFFGAAFRLANRSQAKVGLLRGTLRSRAHAPRMGTRPGVYPAKAGHPRPRGVYSGSTCNQTNGILSYWSSFTQITFSVQQPCRKNAPCYLCSMRSSLKLKFRDSYRLSSKLARFPFSIDITRAGIDSIAKISCLNY